MIRIKKVHPEAKIPCRANPTDAGADLCSVENLVIPAQSRTLVSTGITLQIPDGYYGRVAPRSGLAVKSGIDVLAGVIDSGYRGTVGVVLYNTDKEKSFEVKVGDRIAQIIFEQHWNFSFKEADDLVDSERSINGFGSTGIK
jgi:dUTP pyrophosphatase